MVSVFCRLTAPLSPPWCAQGLLTTASKSDGVYKYNFATVPLLAEFIKLVSAHPKVINKSHPKSRAHHVSTLYSIASTSPTLHPLCPPPRVATYTSRDVLYAHPSCLAVQHVSPRARKWCLERLMKLAPPPLCGLLLFVRVCTDNVGIDAIPAASSRSQGWAVQARPRLESTRFQVLILEKSTAVLST